MVFCMYTRVNTIHALYFEAFALKLQSSAPMEGNFQAPSPRSKALSVAGSTTPAGILAISPILFNFKNSLLKHYQHLQHFPNDTLAMKT